MDVLAKHYEAAFTEGSGELYEPLTLMGQLSTDRRVDLLNQLPLGDLSDATVVDYGVGSWGFGCIFPKLKTCKKAIGVDVSQTAINLTKAKSHADPLLKGKEMSFFTSNGYDFPIETGSVDLFFCGECIEHIEDTDAFLSEVHRVMKVGGRAIFTTPNMSPYVYRQLGLKWCIGFEHVALMDTHEFEGFMRKYFTLLSDHGYNQSIHPAMDAQLDPVTAKAWVYANEHDPENATALVAFVQKTDDKTYPPVTIEITEYNQAKVNASYMDLPLLHESKGRMVTPGGGFTLNVPKGAKRANLIFWAHAWSGYARITAGAKVEEVDLYSHIGGCHRIRLECEGVKTITIESLDKKRPESSEKQVIFFRAVFAI